MCISGKLSHTDIHVFVFMMMFLELFLLRKSSEFPKWDLNPQPSDHRWDALTIQLRARFRNGQAGQLPRGLHNQGASTYIKICKEKCICECLSGIYSFSILHRSQLACMGSIGLWTSLLLLSLYFPGYFYGSCIVKVTFIVSLSLVNPAFAICTLLYKIVEVYSAHIMARNSGHACASRVLT